jgi:hypothetical protein
MSAPLAPGGPASIQYAQNAVAGQPDSTFVYAANGLAETIPAAMATTTLTLATGTASLAAVHLGIGTVVSNVGFVSVAAAVGQSHAWAVITDQNGIVLGASADLTTTNLAATTWNTLALGTAVTTKYSGLYYLGVMAAFATTAPTVAGSTAPVASMTSGTGAPTPKLAVTSTAFATTPPAVGASMATLTAAGAAVTPYLFCS